MRRISVVMAGQRLAAARKEHGNGSAGEVHDRAKASCPDRFCGEMSRVITHPAGRPSVGQFGVLLRVSIAFLPGQRRVKVPNASLIRNADRVAAAALRCQLHPLAGEVALERGHP